MLRWSCSVGIVCIFALLMPSAAFSQSVELSNKVIGDGSWRVLISDGGEVPNDGYINPIGPLGETEVIYDYHHYVDVGADGGAQNLRSTTITSEVTQNGAQLAISSGEFAGQNAPIRWTAKSVLPAGSNVYIVRIQFASDQPFGKVRFIQYLD